MNRSDDIAGHIESRIEEEKRRRTYHSSPESYFANSFVLFIIAACGVVLVQYQLKPAIIGGIFAAVFLAFIIGFLNRANVGKYVFLEFLGMLGIGCIILINFGLIYQPQFTISKISVDWMDLVRGGAGFLALLGIKLIFNGIGEKKEQNRIKQEQLMMRRREREVWDPEKERRKSEKRSEIDRRKMDRRISDLPLTGDMQDGRSDVDRRSEIERRKMSRTGESSSLEEKEKERLKRLGVGLTQALLKKDVIDKEILKKAVLMQVRDGQNRRIGTILVEEMGVDHHAVFGELARVGNVEGMELQNEKIDKDRLEFIKRIMKIGGDELKLKSTQKKVIPFKASDSHQDTLVVLSPDPTSREVIEIAKRLVPGHYQLMYARSDSLNGLLQKLFPNQEIGPPDA